MEYEGLIQKAKELLEISTDIPIVELYNKLWGLRNNYHPDKYLNEDAKKKGEENFKEISTLLNDLHHFIEKDKLQKMKSQVILYDDEYEIIKIKQENLNNDNEINKLKLENEMLKRNIDTLENRINDIISKKAEEREEELILKYKNSKRSVISLGVILTLTAVISIMTKIEEVSKIIAKYSPVDQKIINIIVFGVLILSIILSLKKFVEKNYINKLSNTIRTSLFIRKFFIILDTKYGKDYFSEVDVTTFILQELLPKKTIKRRLIKYTNILSPDTLDAFKDIFIYHLYEKSLIEFHDAHCLDRFFRIKKSYSKDIQERTNKVNEVLHNII